MTSSRPTRASSCTRHRWPLAVVLVLLPASATPAQDIELINSGFESLTEKNTPTGWNIVQGTAPIGITTEDPHGGQRCGRISGDGKPRAWRQKLSSPSTRIYSATGWFRAKNVRIDKRDDDYARFYFHILYKDRPYSDSTHVYADLPPGTYDWRRFAVRLVPKTAWPTEEIWVTVAARFSGGTLDFDDITFGPAEPHAGAVALEWANHAKATVITDMGKCRPASALTSASKRGQWRLIAYEAEQYKGRLIWASAETGAPQVALALPVEGWHAIYVGLTDPSSLGCKAWLKIGRDPAPVPRSRSAGQIEEVLFKVADLRANDTLCIAQQSTGRARGCGVAYVKLVPLTPDEVRQIKADRADRSHRPLAASLDGFSFIYDRRPTTRQALLAEVEVYRNTDFDTLILQMTGADQTNYPSQVGEMMGQDLEEFGRPGDRYYAEAIRELASKGINPTEVLIEGAHDVGMKVHVAIRPAAWIHTPPLDHFFRSRFYDEHPEWRCVDRDGTPVARMSLAVREVRKHLVAVLREAVRLGADGAHVIYVRGVPVVLYEQPFVGLFRERHGEDPRELPESDPRIRKLRAEVVTTFMREIRAMLDAEQGRRSDGERLRLSAFVLANEADNLRYGIDVRRWVDEGLLDLVLPYNLAGGRKTSTYDVAFFRDVCQPKGIPVRPTLISWRIRDLKRAIQDGVELYDQGADGITFWDANSSAGRNNAWSVVSRFGHVDELRRLREEGPPRPVTLRFHKIGGMVVDGRFHPNWGF